MLPKNFLWGLETCLKYVTTSPDLGLSNGTKIVAFGALEKIRHPYLKKRRPHLAFESYFSNSKMQLSMMGSEEDWERLVVKLEKVEEFLKPIDNVLQLGDWFNSCKVVLRNLLETYRGNPDKDWWSRIMNINRTFGSGGGKERLIINFYFSMPKVVYQ